ncbi:MAG: OsmC family protein [Trueperaceae bacterium]
MATITTTYEGDALFASKVGHHSITIDVPEAMGGKDRALQPPQLFIVSLGSCVGAMVVDYCERHALDTTGLTVDVDYEKADKPTRLTNLVVRVRLPNAHIDDERTKAILQRVAEHCPVHETIETMEAVTFDIAGA